MKRRPPRSTLFPYPTLFRSRLVDRHFGRAQIRAILQSHAPQFFDVEHRLAIPELAADVEELRDRKSTRLNSSHQIISYAVFCLKKKNSLISPDVPAYPSILP